MEMCVCSVVRQLATNFDEARAKSLIPALNQHLHDLGNLLSQSKILAREASYRITCNNQRTRKALFVGSVDLTPIEHIYNTFIDDIDGFWTSSTDLLHTELRRRLARVVIFLRSKLGTGTVVPAQICKLFQSNQNYTDLKNSGRKYLKLSRKLGGIGSLLWLPLDVPPSTYERYLNVEDEEILEHLRSLGPRSDVYASFVQNLILHQVRDSPLSTSHLSLASEFGDVVPASDQLLLLINALGGSDIPNSLLVSVRHPQRRWGPDGDIESIDASRHDLPAELVDLLSDDTRYAQACSSPYITRNALEDGSTTWTLCPGMRSALVQSLSTQTVDEWNGVALNLICFACPPCYEGDTTWSPTLKKAAWPLLEKLTRSCKGQMSHRQQALEAVLYFCERDSVPIRRAAVERSRALLRKPMPYYLHASVVLFRSIIFRLDGELAKSEAQIRDFQWRGPKPSTRRDHALAGRLHISQTENKVKCYDNDVPSFIYKWEAEQPLSALDIEVTSRLQSAAARFFQSVGDFGAARASLEQFLALNTANPTRASTRQIIIGRLADIYCEMSCFLRAHDLLHPEIEALHESDRPRRPFRRLLLASVEANIGLGRLDAAETVLSELEAASSFEMEDIYDQQLHMRRLFAAARIAYIRSNQAVAILRWNFAFQEIERMHTLKAKHGFTAALIHLSLAHAHLSVGNRDAGHQSWLLGVEILNREKCEYWIPIVPTIWLQNILLDLYRSEGWSSRVMLPGGRPDLTWP